MTLEELNKEEKNILSENNMFYQKIKDNNLKLKNLETSLFEASQKEFLNKISIQDLINNKYPLYHLDTTYRLREYCKQFNYVDFNGYRSLKNGGKIRPVLFGITSDTIAERENVFNDYKKFIMDTVDVISENNVSIYETNVFLDKENILQNIFLIRVHGMWKVCIMENDTMIDYIIYNDNLVVFVIMG